jgi:transposase-like protein
MADWAPLTQLQASEARRQLAEKALRDKQEQEAKAAALALEKAKAKEEEERVIAENVRIEMDKRKAGWFRCHCCRESFNEPKDPASDFGPAIAGLIVSGLLAFIPVIGWALGAILAIYCFCIILASQIVAPYCPSCRSSNFSRPEKTGEKK